jgi:hypothetical protein
MYDETNEKGKVLIYGKTLQSAQAFYELLKEKELLEDYTYVTTCWESKGCGFTCEQIFIEHSVLNPIPCDILAALIPCLWHSKLPQQEQIYYFYRTDNSYIIIPRILGTFQQKIFV